MSPTLLALAAMVAVAQSPADAVPQRTFVIQEPFGLAWGPDRVTYRVQLIQGEARPESLRLTDGQGRDVPVQLTEVDYWPDRTARSADVSFMVSLKPDEKAVWKLAAAGSGRAEGPAGGIQVREGQVVELSNNCTAIRLAGGRKSFASPPSSDQVPAPIQGVRLRDGRWIGKGWWQTDVKCLGYSVEVTDRGPVFARVKLRYEFEGGRYYLASVELNAGQDLAVVSEEYNLSEGKRYPMSGLNGMKAEGRYAYVRPKFDPPDRC